VHNVPLPPLRLVTIVFVDKTDAPTYTDILRSRSGFLSLRNNLRPLETSLGAREIISSSQKPVFPASDIIVLLVTCPQHTGLSFTHKGGFSQRVKAFWCSQLPVLALSSSRSKLNSNLAKMSRISTFARFRPMQFLGPKEKG